MYSGSAFIEDGKMYLYYTGNVKFEDGEFDYIRTGREANTVLVVSEDGEHFGRKRELMRNSDYPQDLTCHVRDPKVWKENGMYYMVQGARTQKDEGKVLIFESEDQLNWIYKSDVRQQSDLDICGSAQTILKQKAERFYRLPCRGWKAACGMHEMCTSPDIFW